MSTTTTLQVLQRIRNGADPCNPDTAYTVANMQPIKAQLYKRVDLDSLLNSVETQEAVDYILQHTNGNQFSEADTFRSIGSLVEVNKILQTQKQQLEEEKSQHEFLTHVHNLKALAMDPMFEAFMGALSSGLLKGSTKQMFSSCKHFMEFTNNMVDIMDNQQLYQEVVQAVTPFIKKYGTAQFWACAEHVYGSNAARNEGQHPDISSSAQYMMRELKLNPQRGGEGGAMLMALAKFAEENSAPLMARHKQLLKLKQEAADALRM